MENLQSVVNMFMLYQNKSKCINDTERVKLSHEDLVTSSPLYHVSQATDVICANIYSSLFIELNRRNRINLNLCI